MKRIGVVIFPGFEILDMAALAVFELANHNAGKELYHVDMLSETGGLVASSYGVAVDSRRFASPRFDTVVVVGAITPEPSSDVLCKFLRATLKNSRRVTSICTGAFILAEAGLLDGRRATTHWNHARALQARFPQIKVEQDRIFINDGPVWTSAGMTAGIDLMLALVEEDLGADASRLIAKKLVVYHRRSGGQSQFSALLELEPKSDRIQKTLTYAKANLRKPLSIARLAEVAHLSPRQFSRAFKTETGQSPARAIESLRVEAARALIDAGSHSIDTVAKEAGFGDTERMRRAFLRAFDQPPRTLRRAAKHQTAR
jgi:transcriptional regulator GlxA family with amidase domain